MHICFITSVFSNQQGGIGGYVYNLGKKLVAKGNEVTIITRDDRNNEPKTTYTDGMNVFYSSILNIYPIHIFINKFFAQKTYDILKNSIDIIHFHTPLPAPIKHNKKNIVTFHTPMLVDTHYYEITNYYTILNRLMAKYISFQIEKKLINESSLLTVVANSVKHELIKHYNVNSEIHVIENGVDIKKFFPSKTDEQEEYILYVGRLTYRKGLFDLIEAYSILDKKERINLYIVGEGPIKQQLKRIIKRKRLEEFIFMKGLVTGEKLVKLYQNAKIFVLPSYYEGLPTVLLEAMACGIPVVATETSGNVDVIKNYNNGVFIQTKSPSNLATTIELILSDASLQKKLGKSAIETIHRRFDWDIIYQRFEKQYKRLI